MSTHVIQEDSIYVVGVGASTPVGRSVFSAAAAVRCGIAAFAEHPFMIDKHGEPMVVSRAKWLDKDLPLEDRVVALTVDAAREALGVRLHEFHRFGVKLQVHIALSAENLPGAAQRSKVLGRLTAEIGNFLTPEVDCVTEGHAGGMLALENACRVLRRGEAHICLVGGADSWLAPERLDAIDAIGRLHSVNNSWGFIPGEGAGFCLVTTGALSRRYGLSTLAELLGVATAQETKLMGTETVCIGEGLTAAFGRVLDPRHQVSHCYCDFNGETYRADEYGFAICRTSEHFENAGRFTAGAECWGDVGAASGALALALPVAGWVRGHARGAAALAWCSSAERPLRGAALMKRLTAKPENTDI